MKGIQAARKLTVCVTKEKLRGDLRKGTTSERKQFGLSKKQCHRRASLRGLVCLAASDFARDLRHEHRGTSFENHEFVYSVAPGTCRRCEKSGNAGRAVYRLRRQSRYGSNVAAGQDPQRTSCFDRLRPGHST